MVEKISLAMLSLGIMIGLILPSFPAPLNVLNPYLWIIFLVIAIVFFLKK